MSDNFESRFDEAFRLRDADRRSEALEILLALEGANPKRAALLGMIATLYRELGDIEQSVKYFQRTVDISPRSELASLGVFHGLFALGRKNEAFAEMRRFMDRSDSPEYRRLMNDLNKTLSENPERLTNLVDPPSRN